jgi:hypothetical protein
MGLWVLFMTVGTATATTVVDEIVATVDTTPLLASDIDLAVITAVVPRTQEETEDAYRQRVLEARIRLEVQYRDLESTGVLYRLEPDVGPVRDGLVERAGGEAELGPSLAASGLVWADVDDLALRLAAVDAYVAQRLRPRIDVSLDEIEAAYRDLVVEEYRRRGTSPPPLEAYQDEIYRLLIERELNDEIARWIAQAEAQLEVTVFAP